MIEALAPGTSINRLSCLDVWDTLDSFLDGALRAGASGDCFISMTYILKILVGDDYKNSLGISSMFRIGYDCIYVQIVVGL
jgi:hypothetical protein